VHVAISKSIALLTFGELTNAITAELYGLSNREDVGWLYMLMCEALSVEELKAVDDTDGHLLSLFRSEWAFFQYVSEFSVRRFEDCIDEMGTIKDRLATGLQFDQVLLLKSGDDIPASEYLIFIVERLNETDYRGGARSIGSSEERASPLRANQMVEAIFLSNGFSFEVIPKFHSTPVLEEICFKEKNANRREEHGRIRPEVWPDEQGPATSLCSFGCRYLKQRESLV